MDTTGTLTLIASNTTLIVFALALIIFGCATAFGLWVSKKIEQSYV